MTTLITNREKLLQALRDRTPKSGRFWASAKEIFPGGLASAARKYEPYPFFAERGQGPYIWDVDGNRYLDCCLSYGTLILGHRPSVVLEALFAQEEQGVIYATPHPLEIAFAERFLACVPCAERMLICSTGTEATMQGIRIMRAYTGKDRIGKFEGCFHGWHDYAMWNVTVRAGGTGGADPPIPVPESAGIPRAVEDTLLILPLEEEAFAMIEQNSSNLAGVMIEPLIGQGTLPIDVEFLRKLREVTKKLGLPLMFDEVKTGFRLALGGAQEYYGVIPDLATYGKIIGGGMPIGAVGCSKQMMDAVTQYDFSISVAGTFSGNPMTLAAGHAILGYLMENRHIYDELEAKGNRLRSAYNEFAQSKDLPTTMTGAGSMFQVHMRRPPIKKPYDLLDQHSEAVYDLQLFSRLNGVHVAWSRNAFISTAHSEAHIDEILRAYQASAEAALAFHGLS